MCRRAWLLAAVVAVAVGCAPSLPPGAVSVADLGQLHGERATFAPFAGSVIAYARGQSAVVKDLATKSLLAEISFGEEIHHLTLSSRAGFLAIVGNRNSQTSTSIWIVDVRLRKPILKVARTYNRDGVDTILFAPDDSWLVIDGAKKADSDRPDVLEVYRLPGMQRFADLPFTFRAEVSPDGRRLTGDHVLYDLGSARTESELFDSSKNKSIEYPGNRGVRPTHACQRKLPWVWSDNPYVMHDEVLDEERFGQQSFEALRFFDLVQGKDVRVIPGIACPLALSSDHKIIFGIRRVDPIHIEGYFYDLANQKMISRFPADRIKHGLHINVMGPVVIGRERAIVVDSTGDVHSVRFDGKIESVDSPSGLTLKVSPDARWILYEQMSEGRLIIRAYEMK